MPADVKPTRLVRFMTVVVHDERGKEIREREHETDGGEVIQDDMDMRPRS